MLRYVYAAGCALVVAIGMSCMTVDEAAPDDELQHQRGFDDAAKDLLCQDAVFDVNPRRSLFETHHVALKPFSMPGALKAIAVNSGLVDEPKVIHDFLFDTYDVGPGLPGSPQHCDDQLAFNGLPGLNGFPLECPRAESDRVGEIDGWFPIAAVNRFDLAPANGKNCGEARLVFAHEVSRVFVIFEAKIPNPSPDCGINACAPVQQFWASLTDMDDPDERAKNLVAAYFGGHPKLKAHGFPPFFNFQAFSVGEGQLRTNNFNQGPWTLREFKAVKNNPSGHLRFIEVPVAANPYGEYFNELAPVPNGDECRKALVENVVNVIDNNVNLMGVSVPPKCLAAESPDDFVQQYAAQLVPGGSLESDLAAEAATLGSPLTGNEVALRVQFAGACIGCHSHTSGVNLGDGVTGPISLGFVHTLEFTPFEDCGDGDIACFEISPALKFDFLPFRELVMESYLNGIPCCGGPGPGGPIGPGPYDEIDPLSLGAPGAIDTSHLDHAGIIALEAELDARQVRETPLTIGGFPTWRVH